MFLSNNQATDCLPNDDDDEHQAVHETLKIDHFSVNCP